MRRFGNRLQRLVPNVTTFRQNVQANLSNFIQDLFWRMKFSNENFKVVEREIFKQIFQDGRGRHLLIWRLSRFELTVLGAIALRGNKLPSKKLQRANYRSMTETVNQESVC